MATKKVKADYLKIGDTVIWRDRGQNGSALAKVTGIEKVKSGEKYGQSVDKVKWSDNFVVDLDNGHWAKKDQLTKKV